MHEAYTSIVDFGDARAIGPRLVQRERTQPQPQQQDTSCVGVLCQPGLTCVGGACLDTSCIGVLCQPGSVCIGGACTPTQTAATPTAFVAPAPAATPGPTPIDPTGGTGTGYKYTPSSDSSAAARPAQRTRTHTVIRPQSQPQDTSADNGSTSMPQQDLVGGPLEVTPGAPWWMWALGLGAAAFFLGRKTS